MQASSSSSPVALITGASGGLGHALVAEFARQGWRVAAACHTRRTHRETDQVWPAPLDVTSRAQAEALVDRLLERWQRIDVLVNNAGLTIDRPCWQIEDGDWEKVLDVNLTGVFVCTKAVLPAMLRQHEGQIINISSMSGKSGRAGQANYAAAKAGLLGFTAALAREVGSRNLRVNNLLPGLLRTPMTARLQEAQLGKLAAENVLGRLSSPAEVARFAVFLTTLRDISGQTFQLDSRITPWS